MISSAVDCLLNFSETRSASRWNSSVLQARYIHAALLKYLDLINLSRPEDDPERLHHFLRIVVHQGLIEEESFEKWHRSSLYNA